MRTPGTPPETTPATTPETTLVCLHALGMSARSFGPLARELAPEFDLLALDLPGFGGAPLDPGTSVPDMTAWVREQVTGHLDGRGRRDDRRWLLLGHSMGGKVATVLAAGLDPAERPAGVVLLAASPPSPEPMDEERRRRMLGWAADGPLDEAAAGEFLAANTGGPLDPALDALAREDLHRTDPAAWRAWLEHGSREDLSARVGRLDVPALVVAGGADGDLGPQAQRELNGAVYPAARFRTLDGAGHLLPLERPAEVAAAIRQSFSTGA
ncbi:alpha/beta fold hydrolase [Kineococcus sp. LSe6-4]|uniref:Alpha/beta fold hydrolase n=1 Tax=Kineococcus halophytocola TaxID=3234027 RepID=A0ABV4H0I2_9ACTN